MNNTHIQVKMLNAYYGRQHALKDINIEIPKNQITESPISNLALSIVIVNYNTRQLLDDCLVSLLAAEVPPGGMEIIVVDNASGDGSQALVREKYPTVRLVASEVNRGFSAANNMGVAVANGRTVLFLNSDTRLEPDALVKPLAYLDQHPEVGALTVRLIYPTGQRVPDNHRGFPTPWNAICHFSGLSKLFPHDPRFNCYFQSYADMSQTHPVDVIAGSYMLMPMNACTTDSCDPVVGCVFEPLLDCGGNCAYCTAVTGVSLKVDTWSQSRDAGEVIRVRANNTAGAVLFEGPVNNAGTFDFNLPAGVTQVVVTVQGPSHPSETQKAAFTFNCDTRIGTTTATPTSSSRSSTSVSASTRRAAMTVTSARPTSAPRTVARTRRSRAAASARPVSGSRPRP